jgi:pimeloyl-ACP methyl ester carboxylesterase
MERGRRGDAGPMTVTTHFWNASDGFGLAWRETGAGPAVILLHGLFSDAQMNWIKFGHAGVIAARGFRVIMPDLRAHGLSGKPHEPEAYPRGILARDLVELVDFLGVSEYDLGGFSLGSRTTVQAVGEGLKPRRAILGGMGFEGLTGWQRRRKFFDDAIAQFDTTAHGDPPWLAIQFMKTMKIDRVAAALLLSTFEDARPEWLAAFTMPTLVVCGANDHDNGSASKLAEALPKSRLVEVPGTHMSSVTQPKMGLAIADFLAAP